MEIKNKTKLPLRVKLPGGKLLRLSPGGVGQIAPKAAEHPAVKALLDDGTIEIVGDSGGSTRGTGGSAGTLGPGTGGGGAGGVRHTGDR